jgi:alpha-L-rhamnosidase
VQTIPALSVTQASEEITRIDFGQNLAGWVRLQVRGSAGTSVPMRFFEDNGASYGQADWYVLKGGEAEAYEPRFTWHGFQFAEVMGSKDLLAHASLEARVVHTDVAAAGTF